MQSALTKVMKTGRTLAVTEAWFYHLQCSESIVESTLVAHGTHTKFIGLPTLQYEPCRGKGIGCEARLSYHSIPPKVLGVVGRISGEGVGFILLPRRCGTAP